MHWLNSSVTTPYVSGCVTLTEGIFTLACLFHSCRQSIFTFVENKDSQNNAVEFVRVDQTGTKEIYVSLSTLLTFMYMCSNVIHISFFNLIAL